MSDIDQLNERIAAALGRIRSGVDSLGAQAPVTPPVGDVIADLGHGPSEDNDKRRISELEAELAEASAQLADLDGSSREKIEELEARLVEERTANKDLEARVEALKTRVDEAAAARASADNDRKARLSDLDGAVQTLQAENAELRDLTGQLRDAITRQLDAPELVNRALAAELEALRNSRATEAAEVAAILAELKPMLEEAS